MAFDYINEAFKKLELLDEQMFDTSLDGINKLANFMDDDTDEVVRVIDTAAESDEDLQDSYVGKVIINCNICHSHVFENKEDVKIEENGTVNVEMQCPYCGEQEGFTIVGEIAPFAETNVEVEGEDIPVEGDVDNDINEGLFNKKSKPTHALIVKQEPEDGFEWYSFGVSSDIEALKRKQERLNKSWTSNTPMKIVDIKTAKKLAGKIDMNDVIEESVLGAIGLGLATGAASAVGNKITSTLLDDVNNADEDEMLTESYSYDEMAEFMSWIQDYKDGALWDNFVIEFDSEEDPDIDEVLSWLEQFDEDAYYDFVGDDDDDIDEMLTEDKNENKSLKMSRATKRVCDNDLKEDFKEVSITTEDQHMEMTSDENGKVTVTTEPIENTETSVEEETIAPVSVETQEEILDNNDMAEEPVEEAPIEEQPAEETTEENTTEEASEVDIDEIDEEGLDELGESYLRKVYENVQSFKTSSVAANDQSLIVEGIITFNSGARKKTGFVFEAKDVNSKGQVRFNGSNKQLTEVTDAYSLVGRVDNKKLFVESLKYNYKVNEGFVRGLVRRK